MKAMPQSAKALKLVGDVHASNPGGREKVSLLNCLSMITPFPSLGPFSFFWFHLMIISEYEFIWYRLTQTCPYAEITLFLAFGTFTIRGILTVRVKRTEIYYTSF